MGGANVIREISARALVENELRQYDSQYKGCPAGILICNRALAGVMEMSAHDQVVGCDNLEGHEPTRDRCL